VGIAEPEVVNNHVCKSRSAGVALSYLPSRGLRLASGPVVAIATAVESDRPIPMHTKSSAMNPPIATIGEATIAFHTSL
jgi:hypothetical protein